MKISDIIEMSILNLWRRRVRTILTVLGVVIGTASIVVMISIGTGMKESMMKMEESYGGLTEIQVSSDGDMGSDEMLLSDKTIETFKGIEHVDTVYPQIWYNMPIQVGRYETNVYIIGADDEYLKDIELETGELPKSGVNLEFIMGNQVITEFYDTVAGEYPYWEKEELPNVDLMATPMIGGIEKQEVDTSSQESSESSGEQLADPTFAVTADNPSDGEYDDLEGGSDEGLSDGFSFDDFYDEESGYDNYSAFTADMKRVPLKVAGITAGGVEAQTEYSYSCYTRLEDLKEFLKKNYSANEIIPEQPTDRSGKPYRDLKYNYMVVKVDKSENVEEVLQTIQDMGFRAESNKEWLEQTEKSSMIIEAVLGGIGAVSMLVAAISIANTMTMSIYERTKEIGVMKVLGCGLASIRSMFLTEAAFIGFIGGVVGIVLSFLMSLLLNKVAPSVASEIIDLPEGTSLSVIQPWLVMFAIIFSTIIGMVAGFFPAQRATRLSPLAAIRND